MAENKDEGASEDFGAMLAEFEGATGARTARRKDPRPGEAVRAKIVSIGADAAFVDLGAKAEGMLELADFRDPEGRITLKVGDTIDAIIVEVGGKAGCAVLRRATGGRGAHTSAEVEAAYAHRLPVEGTVTGVNKGGVEVQVAGMRGFCPISQLELRHVEDATIYVGRKLTFRITKLETEGRKTNLVVSRRALLEEEQSVAAADLRATLAPGAIVRGKVTSLRDFGAFVDLGGIEGLLHVSELGFSRIGKPGDVLAVGQEVEVQILKIEQTGDAKRPEKISLSLKSLADDPWQGLGQRFPEGTRVPARVVRVETFGAFVELAPGIEGLLHISELGAGKHLRHAKDAVKAGQDLEVTVLGVDVEKRRIALALAKEGDGEPQAQAPVAPRSLGTFADLLRASSSSQQASKQQASKQQASSKPKK